MIKRDELALYLNEYLGCAAFSDYAPNGLQVEGREVIKHICTAVTASEDTLKKAVTLQADALLVHHGFFWRGEDLTVIGMKRQRLGHLITNNINLFAYHLPLDCHQELGNNACLARLFEVGDVQMHAVNKTMNLLWSGDLSKPYLAEELSNYLGNKLGRIPQHVSPHDRPIVRIAWCSGAAQDFIEDAKKLGVDAYLSGEISERTYYQAQELGIHYFACGHHASERYGIQALGQYLSTHFGLQHQFIDSENPI